MLCVVPAIVSRQLYVATKHTNFETSNNPNQHCWSCGQYASHSFTGLGTYYTTRSKDQFDFNLVVIVYYTFQSNVNSLQKRMCCAHTLILC